MQGLPRQGPKFKFQCDLCSDEPGHPGPGLSADCHVFRVEGSSGAFVVARPGPIDYFGRRELSIRHPIIS